MQVFYTVGAYYGIIELNMIVALKGLEAYGNIHSKVKNPLAFKIIYELLNEK